VVIGDIEVRDGFVTSLLNFCSISQVSLCWERI